MDSGDDERPAGEEWPREWDDTSVDDSFAAPAGEGLIEQPPEDRKDALLTGSMRKFLFDRSEYKKETHPTYLSRIRARVRNGLLDFRFLRGLDREERKSILAELDRYDRHAVISDGLQFLYTLAQLEDSVIFEEALAEAIYYGEYEVNQKYGSAYEIEGVYPNIDIRERRIANVSKVAEKIERDEALMDAEIGMLYRLADDDEEAAAALEAYEER